MSEWISVEDRLPRRNSLTATDNCLLWTGKIYGETCPYVVGYGVIENNPNYPFEVSHWMSANARYIGSVVTHWQPLPQPPEDI